MTIDRAALTRQIKEANDIVAVIGGYVSLQPAGGKYKGLCPFHNDHRPSMQVDPKWQNFRCWSCGKSGDVITFIQEFEKVSFLEARAMLAQRAGIALDQNDGANAVRLQMLDAVRWAAEQYQHCLLESPLAEQARRYLGERKLQGETVRKFGLGYAPLSGDWLLQQATKKSIPFKILQEVGLLGERSAGAGWYDRFRDRIMFPIRDGRGQTVGFGGRILPNSPLSGRPPKYYNSAETPLFNKSELLYGLDQARQEAATAGCLAVVEGYTDVMMAHQVGVTNVVATMGTALNARHIQHLRRSVPKVVLVFDADEGGSTGVDRALELFLSQNVELAIATLPEGLDPCDFLLRDGPEPFRQAIAKAVDALDYKIAQLLQREAGSGIEGQRRVVDSVLGVMALVPEVTGQDAQVKRELIVNRIAQRLGVREATLWARLRELRAGRKESEQRPSHAQPEVQPQRSAPAKPHERELLQLLLAEPGLVAKAQMEIATQEVEHPGLRQLLEGLYQLQQDGQAPELDALRPKITNPALAQVALELQQVGRLSVTDRATWLERIIQAFQGLRTREAKQQLKSQLTAAPDHKTAVELLKRLQNQNFGSDLKPTDPAGEGPASEPSLPMEG
ncbi:MAG TPA: DNA primase [Gemmataceae bacterium]|nr:DNA primase [Gemmataceae bacterium]